MKKAIILTVLAILFLNFVLFPILNFAVNNLLTVFMAAVVWFIARRYFKRARSARR